MSVDEVFPNPTVKQVLFQIRFPSLFYIETKIGEYQFAIMKSFPKSEVVLQRQLVIGDVKQGEAFDKIPGGDLRKIWKFTSDSGVELEVQSDSLTVRSEHHSSYASGVSENEFRGVISFAVDKFLDVTPVPVLSRIGLRYIDHCPVASMSNRSFRRLYNSCLPTGRFPLERTTEAAVSIVVDLKDGYGLIYKEHLAAGTPKLVVDIDAYHGPLSNPRDYLSIADELHTITSREFWLTAREPLKNYMRKATRGA